MKICTEADYLQAHLTIIQGKSRAIGAAALILEWIDKRWPNSGLPEKRSTRRKMSGKATQYKRAPLLYCVG